MMISFPDYSNEKKRVRSLTCFKSPPVPIEALANNGFYCRSFDSDIIQCHECDLTLGGLQPNDRPKRLHMIYAPHCSYAKPEAYANYLKRHLLASPRQGTSDSEEVREERELKSEIGEANGTSSPFEERNDFIHPRYKYYLRRRDSFNYMPIELSTRKCWFAAGGFFYSEITNHVHCYACGLTISNWGPETDPWVLHNRHYPDCFHLINEAMVEYRDRLRESQL